jgi:hypothetical protein
MIDKYTWLRLWKSGDFTLTKLFVHDIFLHLGDVPFYILGFDFIAMIEFIQSEFSRISDWELYMTFSLKIRGFTLTKRFVHDIFLHLGDVPLYILGFDFIAMIEFIQSEFSRISDWESYMTLSLKIPGFTLTKRFVYDIFLHLGDV